MPMTSDPIIAVVNILPTTSVSASARQRRVNVLTTRVPELWSLRDLHAVPSTCSNSNNSNSTDDF